MSWEATLATVATVREWVESKPSLEELHLALDLEQVGKKRKTVLQLLEDAITAPKTADELVAAFAADDPIVDEPVVFFGPEEKPAGWVAPVEYARGHVRYAWYQGDPNLRLGISFLNAEDQEEFGPNLDLSEDQAKKRGILRECPKGTSGEALLGSGQAGVPTPTVAAPAVPAVSPTAVQIGGAALYGPRYNQKRGVC